MFYVLLIKNVTWGDSRFTLGLYLMHVTYTVMLVFLFDISFAYLYTYGKVQDLSAYMYYVTTLLSSYI